jgi:hypothetical protein
MQTEHIKFEIAFKTNWWLSPPIAAIYLDDCEKFNGDIVEDTIIKFSHSLSFIDHKLSIHRSGNSNRQVRMTEFGHQGQDLIIDWIKIDGVNIRNLIWTNSINTPIYPEPWASEQCAAGIELEKHVLGETHLSHNGVWSLNFTSPFYRFLMDWMG